MKRAIFIVSDGTGITAETLAHALLTQFDKFEFQQETRPFVDDLEKMDVVIDSINRAKKETGKDPIVFSSLTDPKLVIQLESSDACVLDLFSAFIQPMEAKLGSRSSYRTGLSHGLVDAISYDNRIDAVNFALIHDDGGKRTDYDNSEVILVGVSRTGKTPTSVYLAMQFGLKVANYPLTEDDLGTDQLPNVLQPHRTRLFGLTIDPERLQQIRSQRRPNSRYASLECCRKEVKYAEEMFYRQNIPFLITTTLSIEEIASRIIQETGLKRHLF